MRFARSLTLELIGSLAVGCLGGLYLHAHLLIRWPSWNRRANALGAKGEPIHFCVTHPYHPLCGQTFELAAQNKEFGEDRVFYRDADGRMRYLPRRWTSLAAPDPFVIAAAGRANFRLEDLIRVAELIKDLRA